MQLIALGEKVKIVWDGQRIAFKRLDSLPAQEEDLSEAEAVLELLNQRIGGTC